MLGFGVGLVTGSCHSLFFLLACPFVSRVISFIYNVRVRGVVSRFNKTSHSLCGVVRECLLPRSVVVTAKWVVSCDTDYVYPAFVTLLADISCLHFLFRKCLFVVVVLLSLSSLPPYTILFYLWLIGHFVPAC